MKQKKSKIVALEQKRNEFFESAETKSKKKISFGKIVQKTVEIFKKPFSNKNKPEKVEVDSGCKLKKKRKSKEEKQQSLNSKSKSKRKKETIAIDYPKNSLKTLEKEKNHKILNQQNQCQETTDESVESIDRYNDEDQFEEAKDKQKETTSQISTEVNGFFYTNDKFINRFEDPDILQYLKSYYPLFMKDPSDFQTQKKQILDMLQNATFMDQLLSYYDINIYEFFKFLFRLEPDLFKGSFLKRVQKAMRYKQYAIKAKRCSFLERRKTRLKNLKQSAIYSKKP